MSSALRYLVAAAVFVPFACSSDEGGGGADVPSFSGPVPSVTGTPPASGGAPAEVTGNVPLGPAPVGAGGETDVEQQPVDAPLDPGATPVAEEPAGAGGAPVAAGGAPGEPVAGAGGGGGAPDVVPGPPSPSSDLPIPPGNAGVARPAGAPGNLQVLNWAGFRAAVTYTLDDADDTQVQNYDALDALGVPLTFYLWTNRNGAMSNVWSRAAAAGHELGNHTNSHQMGANGQNLGGDTDTATAFIESRFGVTVYTMAAPYGDPQYQQVAQSRFLINRGVGGGQIAPNGNTDRFNVPTFIPLEDSLAGAFNTRVDTARAQGLWETVLVHTFNPGSGFQPVDFAQFAAAVNYSKGLGDVWIGTMVDVGSYWIAQRLLTQAVPTENGDTTTWTWALPDHFPPGQFLRVTVDGGTLSQGDQVLTWDENGYYEVSLDAASLTLAP